MTPAVWGTVLYVGLCAAVILISGRNQIDPDAAHYRDGWRTQALFPDKAVHGFAAWALTIAAHAVLGVPALWAALITLAAGIGWEFMQRQVALDLGATRARISRYDVYGDAIGCAVAVLTLYAGAALRGWLGA